MKDIDRLWLWVCRYAKYGDVSPKIDIYAFGVVLYELISAKEAIVKTNELGNESKGLVALVVFLGLLLALLIAIIIRTYSQRHSQLFTRFY